MVPINSLAPQTRENRAPQRNPSVSAYCASTTLSPLDALKRFDKNPHDFLLLLDSLGLLIGTITHKDIQRALIDHQSFDFQLDEIARRPIVVLSPFDSFATVIDLFQNSDVSFIPIVTHDGYLLNCIMRDQFHTLVLEEITYHFSLDFFALDKKKRQFNLAQRPWGFYKSLFISEFTQTKVITVFPGEQLSLQKHHKREEHWTVAKGEGLMVLGETSFAVKKGDNITIPKGEVHRIKNTHSSKNLVFIEVQLGDYFGEDDIVRLEDTYGRV
ncbi:cupin domain-containing protein [Myxococcota bacterium]|nr:cupin domain-containing protein [Myxococcota bacterium]MBU1534654.1 cupin domain-containing protein [Myxococcota bacterium]